MGAVPPDEFGRARPGRFTWELAATIPAFDGLGTEKLRRGINRDGRVPRGMFSVSMKADPGRPIPGSFAASFAFFRTREVAICRNVLQGVLKHYLHVRDDIRESVDPEFADEIAPVVRGLDDLRPLLAFNSVYVHPAGGGKADLGFGLECAWEEEHGLGVRVWGDEVVLVGHQSDAIEGRGHTEWALKNMGDGMGGAAGAKR
jgi:hypothetical protein